MDVTKLRYFLAIVESRTMCEAAEKLSVVQPTLSQAMRVLEADLGVPLFLRSGSRTLRLTPAGERFVEPARDVLRAVARARAAVQQH